MSKPDIHITDVTLRDGLQVESKLLSSEERKTLFQALLKCSYQRYEITSFSHPKWMPQFADSDSFCQELLSSPAKISAELMAFVPNERGLDRFLKFEIPWVSAFVAASETFNQKNVNQSRQETLAALKPLFAKAKAHQRKVRLYVSTVFGCPYEKEITEKKLFPILKAAIDLGPDEIALSDTIGVATPGQVDSILEQFLKLYPVEKTAMHFHNTYGLALASAIAAAQKGVRRFDGSTGGIGGCPYAKGATGNVPTEELQYALSRQGYSVKIEAAALKKSLELLSTQGLSVRSRLFDIWARGGEIYGFH